MSRAIARAGSLGDTPQLLIKRGEQFGGDTPYVGRCCGGIQLRERFFRHRVFFFHRLILDHGWRDRCAIPVVVESVNIRLLIGAIAGGSLAFSVAGCSKTGTLPTSSGDRRASLACDPRMLRIEDFAGILTAPLVDRRSTAGDGQTCQFLTDGFPAITVSVRPNVGHATIDAWNSGRMPFPASALPGTGDQAVWQGTLREVIAQKNNLLCDIGIRGGDSDIAATADLLPGLLGALCNKLFTAFG
jgi:hypothetical protein